MSRIPAIISMLAALWTIPTSDVSIGGKATYMNPGVMEGVVSYFELDLSGYVGAVALNRQGDKGRAVWLEWEDGTIDGPFLVVDCAQRVGHFEDRERQRRVVEVSWDWAVKKGFALVGPVPVKVWFVNPKKLEWE